MRGRRKGALPPRRVAALPQSVRVKRKAEAVRHGRLEAGKMDEACILWRRLDSAGHDACRLRRGDQGWVLSGAAVFAETAGVAQLRYEVQHDHDWQVLWARVQGWLGGRDLEVEILRGEGGVWRMNGAEIVAVRGGKDLDMGFTPATNTTAIRRLALGLGAQGASVAAWLDSEDWQLKPLAQTYRRSGAMEYEYGSAAHGFRADLTVEAHGLVTQYPGFWHAEG